MCNTENVHLKTVFYIFSNFQLRNKSNEKLKIIFSKYKIRFFLQEITHSYNL